MRFANPVPGADPGCASELRPKLYKFFIDAGVLLRPLGNVVYILPPYPILPADLNSFSWLMQISLGAQDCCLFPNAVNASEHAGQVVLVCASPLTVRERSRDQQNPHRVELLSWGELYDATRRSTWPQEFHPDWHEQQLLFPKRVDCELVEVDAAPFEREEVPPAFAGKFLPWIVG